MAYFPENSPIFRVPYPGMCVGPRKIIKRPAQGCYLLVGCPGLENEHPEDAQGSPLSVCPTGSGTIDSAVSAEGVLPDGKKTI